MNNKRSESLKRTLKKKRDLKNKRIELVNLLRKRTTERDNKLQCQICGLMVPSLDFLTKHIKVHKIKLEDYYKKYLMFEGENICLCFGEVESCKKYTNFISIREGFSLYCSTKCLSNSPLVRSKYKKTVLEKYGVDHISKDNIIKSRMKNGMRKALKERGEEIKKKRIDTCLEKYGEPFVPMVVEIKEKVQNSLRLYRETDEYKNKIEERRIRLLKEHKETLNKYLQEYDLEMLDEYDGAHKTYRFKCNKCGIVFNRLWNSIQQGFFCSVCNKGKSSPELELLDFIKSLGLETVSSERTLIYPKEIDILIPEKKIGVEYNGLWFHSEIFNSPSYHIEKTEKCLEVGIRLIQIFEDEWLNKKEVVKKRIENILGCVSKNRIHARDCTIEEISGNLKNEFLNTFHLQGKDSSVIKLGAFFNTKLVAVMTFSKGNITKGSKVEEGIWELNRFCSDYNYHIPGIASKLLKYFERNYNWDLIYSYADRRWSDGNLYYKLGFDLDYTTKPNYFYIKDLKRINRWKLFELTEKERKNDPGINERILASKLGFVRVYDCGNFRFSKSAE